MPLESPHVTAVAVEPPLSADNAAGRFVFVPAAQFASEGIGGWIAKISKVGKTKDQVTDIQIKDADDRQSKKYFKFTQFAATFKPLS